VDVGPFLFALEEDCICNEDETQLYNQEVRLRIDKLRVAVSRTTQTLVFLDFVETPTLKRENHDATMFFLHMKDVEPVPWDALLERLENTDSVGRSDLLAVLEDSEASLASDWDRSWLRARQASHLLKNFKPPSEQANESEEITGPDVDRALMKRDAKLIMQVLARAVLQNNLGNYEQERAFFYLAEVQEEWKLSELLMVHGQMMDWANGDVQNPFELFETLLYAELSEFYEGCLTFCSDKFVAQLDKLSRDSLHAERFAGNVEAWLNLCGVAGDIPSEANRLRRAAFDALLGAGKIRLAAEVFLKIQPSDQLLRARLREAEGQHREAAEIYDKEGDLDSASRNWRLIGQWDRVTPTSPQEAQDIEWLQGLKQHLAKVPAGLNDRLLKMERESVLRYVNEALGPPKV